MFADGEIPAERIVRQYLLRHGNHVEAMRLLARIGMKLDVLDDAEFLLESLLMLAPDYQAARYDYALALLARHKHVRALEELDKLLEVDPGNRSYKTTYATACVGLGDNMRAVRAISRAARGERGAAADLHLSIAHVLKTQGKQQEAIEEYRTAAACRPNYGDAYWSLANLKTYRFPDDEIARMRAAESDAATPLVDRYHLCFALGKALEDRGEYAESFAYYERGNALKKGEIRFRIEPIERTARLQASVCTRSFFASREAVGSKDPTPFLSLDCRAPDRRSSSKSSLRTQASKARWNWPISRASCSSCKAGKSTNPSRDTRPCSAELDADQLQQIGEKYLADTAFIAPAGRSSSTRCRIISGTSGSFI